MSVCIVSVASAFDIVVDGIGYNITDRTNRTVMVAGWDENYFTSSGSPTNPNVGTGSDDVSGPVNLALPWRVYYNGLYYRVTAINDEAFSDCTSLKTVTIPNMITYIGEYAFQGCTSLQTVTVQWTTPLEITPEVFDGVTLSNVVLRVLSGYKSVYAAANVWKDFGEIREYSDNIDIVMQFEDPAVKAICVENWDTNNDGELTYREAMAVEDISGYFVGNTEITRFNELRSFKGVTVLGMNAFKGCSSLETIQLPSDLTTIQKEAFVGCEALTSVTMYAKLTTIGEKAFYGCANIASISLPSSLTKVGAHAFDGCAKIPSFYIYGKLTDIGEGAFANCTSCTKITGATNTVYSFSGSCLYSKDGTILYCVPAGNTTKNFSVPTKVVEIKPYAFAGGQNINSVTLNNVTRIGASAFEGCKNFYTVIFPETVTQIGANAFKGVAQGIRAQVSWNTPLSIADGTFSTFNPVTEGINGRLFVPTGKKSAYQSATGWKWFDFIEEGTIADYAAQIIQFKDETVRQICVANFDSDHDGYITYDEAAAVTNISTLFKGKEISSFDELQYFTSLASIPAEAFANCTMTSIILPGSVVSIGANAFAYCNNLKTFNVPASVKTIGNGVLKSCEKLTAITVDAENTNYVSALNSLFTKDHSKLIQFPAYNSYTNVVIPDGVKTIAPEAFLGASRLSIVSIYKSVQNIGDNAFGNCTALTEVKVYWSTPLSVPASTFSGVNVANAKLSVPVGTQSLYEEANVWKDFGTKEEFSDQYSDLVFADPKVEAICVSKWDTNGDGKLNGVEAKAVTDLGNAFTGNTEITKFEELQYFTSLKTIADNAFKGCTALTTITMPSTITTIGESAFEGCEILNRPMLPVGLINIGKKAFYGCNAINRFYLYKNVASVGEGAFAHCASLAYFQVQAGNAKYKVANDALFTEDYATLVAYPAGKSQTSFNPTTGEIKAIYPYAFSGATKITSVSFNEITTIGDYAFEDCTGIKAIDFSSKVTTIGEGAFSGCSNLQSINIPSNVTSIGEKAFNGMPAGVRCQVARNTPLSINDNTFSNAGTLSSGQITGILFVPKGTTSRYETANGWKFFALFKEMSMDDYDATIIHFEDLLVEQLAAEKWDSDGDGHISYEEAALVADLGTTFTGQPITKFNELQYFTALTEIGDDAFKNTGLSAVTMPEGITRFGKSSFQGTAINTFNRLPGLTEIGDSAFAYNTGFTKVSISSNIVKVGTGAFKGCPKLTAIDVDAASSNYASYNGVLYDKSQTKLLQFPAAKTISKEYVLDETVTEIGEDAFTMVAALKTLVLHDGVTAIGASAFRACTALDSVVVEWATPLTVPANTFQDVDVKNCALSVPKGSKNKYKKAAVWKNFRIDEYLVDSSVIDFEDPIVKAICVEKWDTSGDGELTVAEAKEAYTISEFFQGNTQITSFNELKYFTGLTAINNDAFRGCTALETIALPKTITNIRKGAFADCTNLKSIQIPEGVTTFGMGVFANCSSLTSISVAADNTKFVAVDGVLFDKNKTLLYAYPAGKQGDYVVPETVTTIKGYAFCGAAGLTSLKLPKTLQKLEEGALENCSSLEFLSIPASVGEVQPYNFYGCTALKTVKVAWANALDVDPLLFYNFNFSGTRLYVPALSKDSYAAADSQWSSFEKIIEYPNCDVNGDSKADMLDAVDIVKYVVGEPATVFDRFLADFDDDDEVTVADAVILVGMIANGEAAPNINYAPRMDVEESVVLTKDINNVLSLCIDSEVPYTAFQFDLTLPELSEVELVKLSERLKGHQMVYNQIGENTYRFAAISFTNKPFEGYDGSVINILAGNPDLDDIVVENIRFVTADGAIHQFENIGGAIPTGIVQVMGDSRKAYEDGVYYNLSGVRVDHPTKGVYILNGKKVVIK
ncbi:MAG: leucine-rich repeat protein [Prevotella sp.]|nr:leucine-rich repeat protein [Prevotella sp.]